MTLLVSLRQVVCYACHVPFGVPETLDDANRKSKKTFWCPQGHEQAYTGPTAEQVANQKAAEERGRRIKAELEAERAWKKAAAEERKRKSLERSIEAGLCPKCGRHFKNVRRHMEGKHGHE